MRNDTSRLLAEMLPVMTQLYSASREYAARSNNAEKTIEELKAKYRAEAMQRRMLFNKMQELKGNIRVFCRVRRDMRANCVLKFPSESELMLVNSHGHKKFFEFEHVFTPESTQEEVFVDTEPIVTSCIDGYNVCILAYGQTGSGKTFTMMGTQADPGVNIRALKELFRICSERKEIAYELRVSIVEIYNEQIIDLLEKKQPGVKPRTLTIQRGTEGNYCPDLNEVTVTTMDDVVSVMARGEENRSVAATAMNSSSSRSHLVLTINVRGSNKLSGERTRGRLMLVDLAGSERVSRSEAQGQRLVEAAAINKSLSALGQVFMAIAQNALHIPYRNSKLTHLLQDALGGDSKTCVFVNCSPLDINLEETISTLTFGQTIQKIELGPAQRHAVKDASPTPAPQSASGVLSEESSEA
jgi:kinesin family member C2/C3